ncbi:unnamed protein product [Allacma fusca]|uniref:Uncharacterized protein n=1 Tax=Allacma fusca TaxID=39272 RepID=A0A8J2LIF3_9HEXA|nr:unnamed protein product [Allacma fusca]
MSPTGHIQYHFKNFWSSLRQGNGSFKLKSVKDPIAEENFENNEPDTDSISMKNWLVNHAAPPQEVFEYMVKTFKYRRMELLKCKHDSDYTTILLEWPRLLETPGAIQHDFSQMYPLVADSLSSKWQLVSGKIAVYFSSMKKSLLSFGIREFTESLQPTAAFLMKAALLCPKIKKMTQMDSMRSFVRVINVFENVAAVAADLPKRITLILCSLAYNVLPYNVHCGSCLLALYSDG